MGVKQQKQQVAYDRLQERIEYEVMPPTNSHVIACAIDDKNALESEISDSAEEERKLEAEVHSSVIDLIAALEPFRVEIQLAHERQVKQASSGIKRLFFSRQKGG